MQSLVAHSGPAPAAAPEPAAHATLIERSAELTAIADAVAGAEQGHGALIVIEAAAGLGKTALLDAAAELAATAGLAPRRAAPGPLERTFAHGVVRSLLEGPLRALPDDERAQIVEGAANDAAGLLLDGREPAPGASTPLAHSVLRLCAALAQERPLALLVDDAQWADRASLEVLCYLARRIGDLPLLLVVGARTADPAAAADLLSLLGAAPAATVLRPAPLTSLGAVTLIRRTAPDAPLRACLDARDAVAGNPWLLEELAGRLASGPDAGARAATATRSAVRRRLAALAPADRDVAAALAVLGDDPSPHDLAGVAGVELGELTYALDGLNAAGLLACGGTRFAHELVATAVAADLPDSERERLNREAARRLAGCARDLDSAGRHLLATGPQADPATSALLVRAACEAAGRGTPALAARYLERALSECAPGDDQGRMLARLGAARFDAGLPGARRHLRTALRETEDAGSRVDVLTQLAALEVLVGASGGVADLVAGEPAADPGMRDRLDVASLDALLPRPDRRAERVERLAALSARALADPVAVRAVLAHRAWAAAEQGDAPAGEAAALALEALAGDVLLRDASGRAAHLLAIRTLVLTDRHADAGAAIERLRDAAHSRGSRPLRAAAAWQAGELALRRGDLAGAEGHARVAIALADDGLDPIAGGALDVLVRTLSERGAFDQAQELLRARDVRTPEAALALRHAEARLRFAMGDHAGAARQAVEAGASAELDGPVNPALLPWRSTAAVALAHLGRRAEASELADAEIALAERFGAPLAVMVAMHAGAVAEPAGPAGVDRLRRALEVGEGTVAVLLTARIRLRLGHILSRSGARVRARDELRPALADADAAGAVPLAEHARRELVASGLRPRRAAIDGADALTPRQREVCTLAANGKGNREIARALFLSMKTVETHLAAGYRKLGIESRAQLAGVLGDAPLTLAAP